jgi:hypothetical protein
VSDHRENAATACGLIDRWGERGISTRRKQEILLIMQALVNAEFAREQAGLLPPTAKDE